MNPIHAELIEWDEDNESELEHHQISPEEVEQVWINDHVIVPNKKHRSGDYKIIGRTDGGRPLAIIIRYDLVRRSLRPITGWRATSGEISRYL